jgi:hypothetical protein
VVEKDTPSLRVNDVVWGGALRREAEKGRERERQGLILCGVAFTSLQQRGLSKLPLPCCMQTQFGLLVQDDLKEELLDG